MEVKGLYNLKSRVVGKEKNWQVQFAERIAFLNAFQLEAGKQTQLRLDKVLRRLH
jgi:hypothetical protein